LLNAADAIFYSQGKTHLLKGKSAFHHEITGAFMAKWPSTFQPGL
jgi:hypothetical protein